MRLLPALLLSLLVLPALAGQTLDWLDLLPPEDLAALEAMPEIEHQGAEAASGFYEQGLKQQAGLPEVMYSSRTVAQLDGRRVRLGGYPVPLDAGADGRFSSFLLVPYPGACIHVPPPPPNQIVLVRPAQPVALEDIYAPLWVEGTLHVEQADSALASSAYALDASSVRPVGEGEY